MNQKSFFAYAGFFYLCIAVGMGSPLVAFIGQVQNSELGNCACICLPKCGTHMLLKFLTMLEVPGMSYAYDKEIARNNEVVRLNTQMPPDHFKGFYHIPTQGPLPKNLIKVLETYKNRLVWSHWMYTPEFAEYLSINTFVIFLMIRDPRDQVVSMARMVHHGYEEHQKASLNDVILDLIDGRQQHFLLWGVERNGLYPLEWESGVIPFYQSYMPWMDVNTVCVIKFEDLVGVQGGGSQEKQRETMLYIAQKLGRSITNEQAQLLVQKLFGDSATFSEGKIGSWKHYFTDEMKRAFKMADRDHVLVRLGYEVNDDW